MYKDLSLKEKADLFKVMVSNGVTDINEIENIYNKYAEEGKKETSKSKQQLADEEYIAYMEKLAEKKAKDWGMSTDEAFTMMMNDNEYNYRAFYENNKEEALKMLTKNPNAHFSDIGKTVWHPTFSNESIYSGKVSEYNPKGTVGGSWLENQYIPSESQITNGDFDYEKTADYLYKSPGKEYIDARYKPEFLGQISNYLELNTFYPFTSRYPYTGHSELLGTEFSVDENGRAKYHYRISKNMGDKDYNLVTNNCSDATRCALENAFNKELNPFLFTTPGDVQDWAIEELGGIPRIKEDSIFNPKKGEYVLDRRPDKVKERRSGESTVYIPVTPEQRRRYIDYVKKGKEEGIFKYGGYVNKFSGVSNETKQEKEIIYPDIVSKNRELWNKEMERRKSRGEDARKKQQKRKSYAEEAHKIMGILNSFAERDLQLKNSIQKSIRDAINEQQEQQREKHYNNKLFLNSLTTAAELGSAAWMLGKGAKALGILPNRVASSGLYSSDTPQIVSGIAGTLADSYQAATATTPKDIIENSIELPFDMAGIIGGTNVFRNTPFFGRYGNAIDNVLDGAGYIAAGYDGIIKPTSWILSQFNNGVTPEEVSIMLPEVTVLGNKKSRGGLINKYDGTSTKTQQMQTMEKPAFFEGDTWKPQYWFSPEYENATLKGAITQAYEDGNYGKDIIWNGRAYKAILNEEDANEYRKKKGIPLGEPIVNTANIQTNEKQPREYVSNSYIPVTNGNKIYYWDSYSGKFFEDAKGKTPTSKDYNTLLKDYYDQNISPALKENRYEDLIKLYVQQFRNLQARRRVSAREQDIPSDYGKRTIPITTGRSGSSRLPYPTDLIDSLSNHLQEGQSIYQALALPYKETEFGNRVNFESDVMGNRGHVLATLNDERYELPDQTFYSGLNYPLRSYFRNNKIDGKVDGMTQENFVKHYLASSENDLLDLKNLFNNKELLKYVGETLKKDLTKSRFVSFMNTNTEDNPNIYEHALSLLASGKYNPGEPGYNKGINKIAKQLENDTELNSYIDEHKIKKVGEKKK